MDMQDAAHRIAHEYPGGLKVLAERLGIGARVFNGKVNPSDAGHVLGLVEALRMQQIAGRFDILYAMADALDHVCVAKPKCSDEDVMGAMSRACAEFGDFLRQCDATMRDGRVTPNELKKNAKELAEMIGAANALYATMSAKAKVRP